MSLKRRSRESGTARTPRARRWRVLRRLVLVVFALLVLLAGAGVLAYALTPLPDLSAAAPVSDTVVLDRHGVVIADLPRGGARHDVVPFDAFPLALRQATIAAEDGSFYSNPGIDPIGIVRAAFLDARLDRAAYGGSTITQQLVRNLLLSPGDRESRSLGRKLHEALLALKLTRRYSKDSILALYLDNVSYGALTYGAEAASELYFGRSIGAIDLAQAALLAGLPRAPSLYDPLRHPDAAHRRALQVLSLMESHRFITPEQERLAATETVRIGSAAPGLAPHWTTYVLGLVADRLGPERVARGGLVIHTTLDLGLQNAARAATTRRLDHIAPQHNAHDAAVVSIDPRDGDILAMVGSADPTNAAIDGAYNVALAPRQPGSAIKPFTYIAALDRWSPGARDLHLTAASLLDDVPTTFYTREGTPYRPQDYDGRFLGRVPLRVALGSSLNVPAVETLARVGAARMLATAHAAGITTMNQTDRYGPALALGGGEVTLLDLTSAYGAIAARGLHAAPRALLSVTDAGGHVLYAPASSPPAQAFGPRGPQLAALMTDILADDGARLPAFGAGSILVLPDRQAAVKTGTTTDWHDNWAVGYTPDLVTGVWVGNADNAPMVDISGITGAAPIWHDVMESALRGVAPEPFTLPPGMVRRPICRASGLLPTARCPAVADELFIAGTAPTTAPTSARASALPVVADPTSGARYMISQAIPRADQKIDITIDYPNGVNGVVRSRGEVRLLVDDRVAATCAAVPCTIQWPLRAGRHALRATTASRRGPSIYIDVAT